MAPRETRASFFDRSGLPRLEVSALDSQASLELLRATCPELDAVVRQRVVADSQGNPLALIELPTLLKDRQRAQAHELPEVLPLTGRLWELFAARIAQLPTNTRQLLLLAALDGVGDPRLHLAASSHSLQLDDYGPAERARLVVVDAGARRVKFRHPLIRATVVQLATPNQRRKAHGLLASALDAQPESQARHLALASAAPDETVARRLEGAARTMLTRGDALGAVDTLVRAADLSPDSAGRARRLAEAALMAADVTGALSTATSLLATEPEGSAEAAGPSLEAASAAAYLLLNGDGDVVTAHRLLTGAINDYVDAAGSRPDGAVHEPDGAFVDALHTLQLVCFFSGRGEPWQPFHAALATLEPHVPTSLWLAARTFADPARGGHQALQRIDAVSRTSTTRPIPPRSCASASPRSTSTGSPPVGTRCGAWSTTGDPGARSPRLSTP